MLKIVSFNVNGVRARLDSLKEFLESHSPDIVGLQETKVADEEFPEAPFADLGYDLLIHGQKTHYGVAILSKKSPVESQVGFVDGGENEQKRFTYGAYPLAGGQKLHVVNAYFPQGEGRSHPVKFPHKKRFFADVQRFAGETFKPNDLSVIMGDFNVSPEDRDVGIGEKNMARWLKDGKCSFLPEEREWYRRFFEAGFQDAYRLIHPEKDDLFSWFDYRSKGFEAEPKRGLRIDHILVSEPLAKRCSDCRIDYDTRSKPKASDHCPVFAEFDLRW